jgi:hypothetical protein
MEATDYSETFYGPPDHRLWYDGSSQYNVCAIGQLVCKGKGKVKGKGHPRTGHEGPEREQRYSSTLSLTSALDEGGWLTSRPGHFTPGEGPVPIV